MLALGLSFLTVYPSAVLIAFTVCCTAYHLLECAWEHPDNRHGDTHGLVGGQGIAAFCVLSHSGHRVGGRKKCETFGEMVFVTSKPYP